MRKSIKLLIPILLSSMFTSCFLQELTYVDTTTKIGIISFGEDVRVHPLTTLSSDTIDNIEDFIDNQEQSNGTALYYSVLKAVSMLQNEMYNDEYDNIFIVTFTDGTDNVSGALYRNENYGELLENKAIGQMAKDVINSTDITSFAIGLYGKEGKSKAQIVSDLSLISTQPPQVAPNIKELKGIFEGMSSTLLGYSSSFILQRNTSKSNDVLRIEFPLKNGKFLTLQGTFVNDGYNPPTFTVDKSSTLSFFKQYDVIEGSSDQTSNKDVLYFKNINFGENVVDENIPIKISVKQPDGQFIEDSEAGKVSKNTTAKNLVFLVLDSSTSLGADFDAVKSYAIKFVDTIYKNSI